MHGKLFVQLTSQGKKSFYAFNKKNIKLSSHNLNDAKNSFIS